MPRRPTRTVPTVVIPGWRGSGEGHWQSWLEDELADAGRETRRPAFADLEVPGLADWRDALRAAIADLTPGGYDVVAHSLGAVLWLHHVTAHADSPTAGRVLLVAPPSPHTDIPGATAFFPPPLDVDTVRAGADGTVLVGSDNDPYLPEGIADAYGRPLKMATTIVADGGHLNPESGYGPWPSLLDWCGRDNLAFY
jgi:hypothetical protein